MDLAIDYVSVFGLMRKSHLGCNLNHVQTGVRAVNFYYFLWELNEQPPDKQSSMFSQALVYRLESSLF